MFTFDEAAQDIMSRFPFESVKEHMDAVQWKWAHKNGLAVPSLERIKESAESLFTHLRTDSTGVNCGGFYVKLFATKTSCRVALRFGEIEDADGGTFMFSEGAEFNPYLSKP